MRFGLDDGPRREIEGTVKDEFTKDQTTFWGVITALMWLGNSLLKYLASKKAEKLNKEKEKQMQDVKNIKEVVIFANEFALLVCNKLKDGIQVQDGMDIAAALFLDAEIKKLLNDAVSDISLIKEEIKDVDASEGVQLGILQLNYVPKYLNVFKK